MKTRLAPLLDGLERRGTRADARRAVETLLCGVLVIMLDETFAPMARFVVREQMLPSAAFAVLWENAIRPLAEPLIECLAVIAAETTDAETLRIRAFTLVGQVFAFRFGRATLARLTAWQTIGPAEAKAAQAAVLANARAILDDLAATSDGKQSHASLGEP